MQRSPYPNDEYTIGWISASHDEFVVGMAVLDEEHGRPQSTPADDTNAKDWFCPPPRKILAAVDLLKAYHTRPKNPMNNMLHIIEQLGKEYAYPGENRDLLYRADYDHTSNTENCDACDDSALIARRPRNIPSRPSVHYGVIASGNMVIKNGVERDRINRRYGNSIFCFEMEAAGLLNNFPCIVVRGISDYSDSHKNDIWRQFAVATASAYAKDLLSHIEAVDVRALPTVQDVQLLNVVSKNIAKIEKAIVENTDLLINVKEETRKRGLQDQQAKCERWLRPLNMRQVQQVQSQKRTRGTCDWIWSNMTFANWYTLSHPSHLDRILLVIGRPGCGKSILAAYIVEYMSKINVNSFLFAFSGGHTGQRNLSDLLRSLTWQLLGIAPAEEAISVLQQSMLKGQPTTAELWTIFDAIAALLSKPVFCVVDGVDECKDTASEFVEKLLDFLAGRSNFRFILLGRHRAFHTLNCARHTIEMDRTLTEQDIETVIKAEIGLSDVLNIGTLRDEVFRTLRQHADGNFLWLKFMLKHLNKSAGEADALQRLRNLPHDLQTTYEQLLWGLVRRLEPSELDLAHKVLAFIIVAQRPLSLDEFQHLLAADALATSPQKDHRLDNYLIPRLERRLLDICGDLVSVADGYVRLVHFSVMEFLMRPEQEWRRAGKSRKIIMFRVPLQQSHGRLASACVEYFEASYYSSLTSDWNTFSQITRRYHLLAYLSRYMLAHFCRSDIDPGSIIPRLVRFLNSDRCITWLEHLCVDTVEDDHLNSLDIKYLGLEEFESWLDEHMQSAGIPLILRTRLTEEHERRRQHYGQNDSRTERIRLILELIQAAPLFSDAHEVTSSKCRVPSGSLDIAPMMRVLRKDAPLPPHFGLDLLLKLQSYVRQFERLIDPLEILFRAIVQKASALPFLVLAPVAMFYLRVERFEDCLEILHTALDKAKRREGHLQYIIRLFIAALYSKLGHFDLDEAYYFEALAGLERIQGPEHQYTLFAMFMIGERFYRLGRYTDALSFFTRVYSCHEKRLPKRQLIFYPELSFYIARIHAHLEEYEIALKFFSKALTGLKKPLAYNECLKEDILHRMGSVYARLGQYENALNSFSRALEGMERLVGHEHRRALYIRYEIGVLHMDRQDYRRGLESLSEVLPYLEEVFGEEGGITISTLQLIGIAYLRDQQYEKALDSLSRALKRLQTAFGPGHPATSSMFDLVIRAYNEAHCHDETE
ncbi:uncharacterized protein CDV56_101837 [Aspergillus thermomutatus]|uniref:Uncharacterized protein n=1 Tax=Aspergillus thermomutatus TaxID=41047 RepID=A0A397G713_ASPTH|nr:uncharacterized protein CDV56_101837 [Aspergillus thermomutatus]RHZ45156.1 hypothetical protein CDV56_101837 [Aspergillus thermomutatus]